MRADSTPFAALQASLRPIPSFLGLPIGRIDDLNADSVALAGIFCDHFCDGQPGSRFAPRQLRYAGIGAGRAPRPDDAIDIGDLNVFPLQAQRNADALIEQSARIAARGARLLAVGGDYSVTPFLLAGLMDACQDRRMGLLRLSRRMDFRHEDGVLTRASASARIQAQLDARQVRLALFGVGSTVAVEEHARAADACIVSLTTLERSPALATGAAIDRLRASCDAFYLSIDADLLTPLSGGQVSSPRACSGLTLSAVLDLLDRFAGLDLRGADVTGHVPCLDLCGAPATEVIATLLRKVADLMLDCRDVC